MRLVMPLELSVHIPPDRIPPPDAIISVLLQVNKFMWVHAGRTTCARTMSVVDTNLSWIDSYVGYLLLLRGRWRATHRPATVRARQGLYLSFV